MAIILTTPRLYLRQFTTADAALVKMLNEAPGVLQYIPEPVPNTEAKALDVLTNILLPQWLAENEIDLGYRFLPSAWGKGYATEAAHATLQYGLEVLNLPRIIAHAHIDNIASQKVLLKIGMQYTGEGMQDGIRLKGYVCLNSKH
jgi:[ribosomal protein S5]-alanine N-acetyltransferase